MSGKRYNVTFMLRAVAAAGQKSNETAAQEFNGDIQKIRQWCSQKEKPTVLKKSGKTRCLSLFINVILNV